MGAAVFTMGGGGGGETEGAGGGGGGGETEGAGGTAVGLKTLGANDGGTDDAIGGGGGAGGGGGGGDCDGGVGGGAGAAGGSGETSSLSFNVFIPDAGGGDSSTSEPPTPVFSSQRCNEYFSGHATDGEVGMAANGRSATL